jgi:hypothetical protein
MKHPKPSLTHGLLASLVVFAAIPAAHAGMLASDDSDQNATVLVSKSMLVEGDDPSVTMIQVSVPGDVFFTTTDLDFPQALEQLQLAVIGTSGPMMSLSGPGTVMLDVTKPTTLYAEVFPMAQDGPDLGLYNLTVSWVGAAPVPLPASRLLLGGALLLGLALLQRPAMRRGQL